MTAVSDVNFRAAAAGGGTKRPSRAKNGKKRRDCSTISAGRAEAQGLFPRVFPRFRGRTVLTALIVTWRPRIRCERRRIHGEEAQADPMGCTDDATVSKRLPYRRVEWLPPPVFATAVAHAPHRTPDYGRQVQSRRFTISSISPMKSSNLTPPVRSIS